MPSIGSHVAFLLKRVQILTILLDALVVSRLYPSQHEPISALIQLLHHRRRSLLQLVPVLADVRVVVHEALLRVIVGAFFHRRFIIIFLWVRWHYGTYVNLGLQLILDGGDETTCQHHVCVYFGQLYSSFA